MRGNSGAPTQEIRLFVKFMRTISPAACPLLLLVIGLIPCLSGANPEPAVKGIAMRPALPTLEELRQLPPDGGPDFNRLIHERSPYLLQHARNPVDWYPWGSEAFEKAKREDKPVFLSVGYSTCHWCHVMERESFESDEIAQVMNRFFVSIKVDREERPDIDEIYMNATQLMTGHGGWPNSVWLTPDGRPWFAGTYFPPGDLYGRPGFRTILERTAEVWRTRRKDIEQQADQLSEAIRQVSSLPEGEGSTGELNRDLINRVLRTLDRTFDAQHGGFGGAPKFPPHGSLAILLYEYDRSCDRSYLTTATRTLEAMALGGIHDHIGGGFHRYSTDDEWFLPHFEKMLYDNAQLIRAYTDAFVLTADPRYRRTAEESIRCMLRDMTATEGCFYSALDADSEGEEGKFYLWTPEEVKEVLGQEEGAFFCRIYNIVPDGNYHDEATGHRPGTSIPHLLHPLEDIADTENVELETLIERLAADRGKLLARRNQRVWPFLDDKVLVSWNGLMIGALARAGKAFDEPAYTAAAEKAARFLLAEVRKDGRLLHAWRGGEAGGTAFLDDYAFLIDGLLDLHEASGNQRYLEEAGTLANDMVRHYWDERDGGFFFTADDHEAMLVRSKDLYDKAIPSGNGIAARALVRLGRMTGDRKTLDQVARLFDAFLPVMHRIPRGTESLVLAATLKLDTEKAASTLETTAETTGSDQDKPDARLYRKPVRLELYLSKERVSPGGTLRVALRLSLDSGWHVNSHKPLEDYLIPTRFRIKESNALQLVDVRYPEGETVAVGFSRQPLSVYRGETWIDGKIQIAKDAPPGPITLVFLLTTQACNDDSCLAPETDELSVTMEISGDNSGPERHPEVFRNH